uniref:Uncharacterized protein n=1 Tax=Anguilla anguilla TaxID=7936 RepID=A0A0E9PI87_ANGAN
MAPRWSCRKSIQPLCQLISASKD